eukprot:gene4251-4671_t
MEMDFLIADVLEEIIASNHEQGLIKMAGRADLFFPFQSSSLPSISLSAYLRRLSRACQCSSGSLVLMLVYLDRLIEDARLLLSPFNIHRLVMTSLLLAMKYHEDLYYNNNFLSTVGGMALEEVNALERLLWKTLHYSLYVSSETYDIYEQNLLEYANRVSRKGLRAERSASRFLHCPPSTPEHNLSVHSMALPMLACRPVNNYRVIPVANDSFDGAMRCCNGASNVDSGYLQTSSPYYPSDAFLIRRETSFEELMGGFGCVLLGTTASVAATNDQLDHFHPMNNNQYGNVGIRGDECDFTLPGCFYGNGLHGGYDNVVGGRPCNMQRTKAGMYQDVCENPFQFSPFLVRPSPPLPFTMTMGNTASNNLLVNIPNGRQSLYSASSAVGTSANSGLMMFSAFPSLTTPVIASPPSSWPSTASAFSTIPSVSNGAILHSSSSVVGADGTCGNGYFFTSNTHAASVFPFNGGSFSLYPPAPPFILPVVAISPVPLLLSVGY